MVERTASFGLSSEDEQTRQQNLETVEYYMTLVGPDRGKKRMPLFTEDAAFELTFTADCVPFRTTATPWHTVRDPENFPDWTLYNAHVYQTQNPNMFFVECDGRGHMLLAGDTQQELIYENHYILSFEMENGKIKSLREFMNPCCLMKARGIPIPEVRLT